MAEWEAFDRLEPIGEIRADYRGALVCQTIAAVMGGSKDPIPLSSFMLFDGKNDPVVQDIEPESILDIDPEVQSALIKAALFGIAPTKE